MVTKILLFTANPIATAALRLDEEAREIRESIRRSFQRETFVLVERRAAQSRDVRRALLEEKPQFLHFAGHGNKNGELLFEDNDGLHKPISAEALAELFGIFSEHLRCVILNSCDSAQIASVISQRIKYAIGVPYSINDHASIAFTVGFYDALANGETIEIAYALGCASISMEGSQTKNRPLLYCRERLNDPTEPPAGVPIIKTPVLLQSSENLGNCNPSETSRFAGIPRQTNSSISTAEAPDPPSVQIKDSVFHVVTSRIIGKDVVILGHIAAGKTSLFNFITTGGALVDSYSATMLPTIAGGFAIKVADFVFQFNKLYDTSGSAAFYNQNIHFAKRTSLILYLFDVRKLRETNEQGLRHRIFYDLSELMPVGKQHPDKRIIFVGTHTDLDYSKPLNKEEYHEKVFRREPFIRWGLQNIKCVLGSLKTKESAAHLLLEIIYNANAVP